MKITKNMLSGMYFIAIVNDAKPIVPIKHLVHKVTARPLGIHGKNCWSYDLTRNVEETRFSSDLRKENSIAFTFLFVSRSFVIA